MPLTPGTYEFRLFLDNGYSRAATSPPVVVDGALARAGRVGGVGSFFNAELGNSVQGLTKGKVDADILTALSLGPQFFLKLRAGAERTCWTHSRTSPAARAS